MFLQQSSAKLEVVQTFLGVLQKEEITNERTNQSPVSISIHSLFFHVKETTPHKKGVGD